MTISNALVLGLKLIGATLMSLITICTLDKCNHNCVEGGGTRSQPTL